MSAMETLAPEWRRDLAVARPIYKRFLVVSIGRRTLKDSAQALLWSV